MQISKPKKRLSAKKTIIVLVIVVILAALGYGAYAYTNDIWPFVSDQNNTEDAKLSDETNTNHGDDRVGESDKKDQDETLKEGNKIQGNHNTAGSGVTDDKGEGVKDTGGIMSDSGKLTLYTPTKNQEISTGSRVTGKTSLGGLHYRLSTSSKQIGLGELSVVNGKFSGTITVNGVDKGDTGTFEVYSLNSQGQEENNIKINVVY